MLSSAMVDRIEQLLAQRVSQRAIKRITGANRRTIARIAAGERRKYDARQQQKREEALLQAGPIERCPGCGGKVEMPCRACLVRSLLARAPRSPSSGQLRACVEPVGLQLREHHRRRYLEVVADRQHRATPPFDASCCPHPRSREDRNTAADRDGHRNDPQRGPVAAAAEAALGLRPAGSGWRVFRLVLRQAAATACDQGRITAEQRALVRDVVARPGRHGRAQGRVNVLERLQQRVAALVPAERFAALGLPSDGPTSDLLPWIDWRELGDVLIEHLPEIIQLILTILSLIV